MKKIYYVLITLAVIFIIGFLTWKFLPVNPPLKISGFKGDLPLERLELMPGFEIEVWADKVPDARQLCISPSGTVFVSNRSKGNVFALKDGNGDGQADTRYTLLTKGNMPNGVAFRDGDLYVAEVNRILKFNNIETSLDNPGEPEVVFDGYPTDKHHGWKYIAFGPDGKLYVPVGAPCNICLSDNPIYASMTTINADGTGMEILHHGIRNTVGFDWHPKTGELWFTDNGRDWMGDNLPDCELNRATQPNQHFGFPFCHHGTLPDPEFGDQRSCEEFMPPVQKLGPHTAPLGMKFYTGSQFPAEFKNQIIIARHGSWNRTRKIGYDVSLVRIDEYSNVVNHEVFIKGWLDESNDDVWGRPVDIAVMHDGTLLISDDFADAIYRVYYKGI
ncbi:MAG TPA: sorbosone dehydrogenase family protein [Saprospiraceae bacterium]|nr:sorbosone dehydrogenase family protein [Saprospiraceae bacterium]